MTFLIMACAILATPKDAKNFAIKTFTDQHKTAKFFILESFQLYSIYIHCIPIYMHVCITFINLES